MRLVLVFVATLLIAASAAAQDPVPTPPPAPTPTPTPTPTPEPTIAPGVKAGGVDLGGKTVIQAEADLNAVHGAPAVAPIVLAVAGERFTLRAKKVKLVFDANRTARRALKATKPGDVGLAIEFIRKPIRRFVDKAAAQVFFPARDAAVDIRLTRIRKIKHRTGRRLSVDKVNKQIEKALADPRLPRLLKPGRKTTKPSILTKELKSVYGTVLTVDRDNFRLRLFKRLRFSRSYGVAVGQPAYPTPTGRFSIVNKQVNPTWTAPNSPWAGEAAGQSYSSSDPNNPLKARWMGIVNGVGIHGTGQEYSIGTAASHGCIRMRVADVIDLYDRVPVGAPVLIR